ncbi:MFS transporter [Solitalea longa]|uniref:MFS transporter n=1 Tax=Solitalea longa TaxID=2079460 RepID=A0A2S5A1Q0_9SPHI|nr:MFS transporter [Solitalea longa]POY36528.1 MFS transporter [Solitalea longa]
MKTKHTFSKYEIFVIAILAILQFTIILDFMVLSPLGPFLMKAMNMGTSQFGLVVSAYAFSAGASGLLAAGFADKFDRKRLLLFFYTGFILGTSLCAMAPNYNFLLFARIVTGIFGGVIGSISFAIITDLFNMEVRGRVMGFVQMAFAASQILGLPIGLVLANKFGWHSPFWMIVCFGIILGMVMLFYLQPINEHLKLKSAEHNAFKHLAKTISQPNYVRAFLGTTLLATGGFMLMPFGSAFSTHNMGVPMNKLSLLYFVTGIFSMILGPLSGKISDKIGKYKMFVIGSIISMIMVAIYTNLGVTPFWTVVGLNILLFVGISSRMISASALMTAVPEAQDRGAFMSINSAVQQISGGIAAAIAGMIVVETKSGMLENYNILGYVVIGAMVVAIGMMFFINQYVMIKNKQPIQTPAEPPVEMVTEH